MDLTFGMKSDTRIGLWNVQTMWQVGRLAEVSREMKRYRLDILGLSETRWNGFGEIRTQEGDTLLYSGREEEHREGVGLLITQKTRKSLIEWYPVSERIVVARFASRVRPITLVQCYAPTETGDEEDKEQFYGQLHRTLLKAKKRDILVVMGDLNAKVGNDNQGVENIMGRHGIGTRNENGERLIELCSNHRLVIGGTIFPHKNCHKVTWVSPDHRTENQIDHFTISKTWRTSLLDVRNKRGADVGSDHHLVVATLRLKIASIRHIHQKRRIKYNFDKLKDKEMQQHFSLELSNRFQQLREEEEGQDIEHNWKSIESTYINTCEKVLGKRERGREEWITSETWEAVNQRKECKKRLNTARTQEEKVQARTDFNQLNKTVKRSFRRDKRAFINNLATQAETAAQNNDSRTLYHITKRLTGKFSRADKPVRAKDGRLLSTQKEQLERWREHFLEILNRETIEEGETEVMMEEEQEDVAISTEPPSRTEIQRAIKQLKNGKAAGMDNIAPEALKVDMGTSVEILFPLFKKIWEEEKIPSDWKKGLLIKLPKKGDLLECDNWRGITLLSIPSKVLSRVILERIKQRVNSRLRKVQAGFREGYSCTDQINTLRIIIEQSTELQSSLYILFVDFEKAFDSVMRKKMWKAMKEFGIPKKIIKLTQEMYENYTCQVLHQGMLSEPIPVDKGVKQGCLLSPILFIMVLDLMMKKAMNRRRGIQWGLTDRLEDLDFADDLCLLTNSFKDMEAKLNDLKTEASEVGLKINGKKTKEMRYNNRNKALLFLGNQEIEQVKQFCYLGSMVTTEGGTIEDIGNRINKAKGAFAMLRPIWKSRELNTNTKLRIFNTNVKSVLLYGCETWKTNKQLISRLQTFVNRSLRNILRIWWPQVISNEELWRRTHQTPIDIEMRRRKWKWIGHTLRRDGDNIARQALEWNPQGSRRRGRPRNTWRRSVIAEGMEKGGKTWPEIKTMARNRVRWRKFIDALCST